MPDNSYLIPQLQKIPGVGKVFNLLYKYDNQPAKNSDLSFTMRPKTIDMIDSHLTCKKTPGPGAYETI